ncbi:MAG: glutamate--tRNA ligase [Flavobacteriaceae bacterium]
MERVRFAPSPTGALHIGGLRTALFNYAYAKKNEGVFVLRIEDTDQNRYVGKAEEYILNSLKWCGIEPDESVDKPGEYGPYRQSERLDVYQREVEKLIREGKAYYAFDTTESLNELRKHAEANGHSFKYGFHNRKELNNSLDLDVDEINKRKANGYVVRLKIEAGTTFCTDEVRGNIHFDNAELEDKILIKADGYPTYHFANVVDDHHMKITTVIRGEEWLSSLPVHIQIYKAFGWDIPKFAHLPLILKPTGKGKLSKRDGDLGGFPIFPLVFNESPGFKEKGFLAEGLVNTLMLLGWSHEGEDELLSLDEFVKKFEFDQVQKGGARFDFEKAKWINQQYIKNKDVDEIVDLIVKGGYLDTIDKSILHKAVTIIHERLVLLSDVVNETRCLFHDPEGYDERVIKKISEKGMAKVLNFLGDQWFRQSSFVKEDLKRFCDNEEIGFGVAMQTLRLILVGELKGPDVFEILKFLENNVIYRRLDLLKNHLEN